MTKPPGKILPLVAALLCGAVLAQAAHPNDQSATTSPPVVQAAAVTSRGPLGTPITRKQGAPSATKTTHAHKPEVKPPAKSVPEDDWNLAAHGKVLYLTFDDGPQGEWTPKVLQVLRKHKAHATFFVLGMQVQQFPELLAAERAAGHRTGNHTWDHPMLTHLTPARLHQEIYTGIESKCFRPPFRDTNARVAAVAASRHQRQILWDVDTNDWKKPGAASIEHAILAGARPGNIILMHDGGGNRAQTVAALDRALTTLDKQGWSYHSLPC
ncbi:polysaccharide deacetylase family protein [Kribbella sp. NPDC026611]|uniref:polysaccharide deacetylase family protein n=1 Tax=Kribbella sp. NPDC026611 TaxID=3154911 RepID=UPI0033F4372B